MTATKEQLQAAGLSVKPLEWSDGIAETPFGTYDVDGDFDEEVRDTPWCVWSPDENLGHFAAKEEALSAAQADYERRILSALISQSEEKGE